MAGFFFCLASTRCRAFILSLYNTSPYKHLQRVLCCPCNYTAHVTKQRTGLYSGVPVDLTYPNERNTADTQAAYYNKVYKGAAVRPLLWIHARRYNIAQTMPAAAGQCIRYRGQPGGWRSGTGSAVRAHRLTRSTRRGSPVAMARQAGGTTGGLPPHLFSGFRPIANRGQQ